MSDAQGSRGRSCGSERSAGDLGEAIEEVRLSGADADEVTALERHESEEVARARSEWADDES